MKIRQFSLYSDQTPTRNLRIGRIPRNRNAQDVQVWLDLTIRSYHKAVEPVVKETHQDPEEIVEEKEEMIENVMEDQ